MFGNCQLERDSGDRSDTLFDLGNMTFYIQANYVVWLSCLICLALVYIVIRLINNKIARISSDTLFLQCKHTKTNWFVIVKFYSLKLMSVYLTFSLFVLIISSLHVFQELPFKHLTWEGCLFPWLQEPFLWS